MFAQSPYGQAMTEAYANAAYIPDGASFPARWAAAAADFRARHAPQTLAYGPGPREALDIFRPAGVARGLLVFIHGGYWRAFDRSDFSHLAAGGLARGWAVAMPSYPLCPTVRVAAISRALARAVAAAANALPGPLVLAGHSAGGHLAARMVCADMGLGARVARAMPISPLANLAPLMATAMNSDLRIDAEEAAAESPMLHPRPEVAVHVVVGGAERPAFLDQARWLSQAWATPLSVLEARHHFDVIDGLADPDSALCTWLMP